MARPSSCARLLFAMSMGVVGFVPRVAAQSDSDFESILEQFNSETVRGYLQPLADLFGANMNTGFFRSAAVPESRISKT